MSMDSAALPPKPPTSGAPAPSVGPGTTKQPLTDSDSLVQDAVGGGKTPLTSGPTPTQRSQLPPQTSARLTQFHDASAPAPVSRNFTEQSTSDVRQAVSRLPTEKKLTWERINDEIKKIEQKKIDIEYGDLSPSAKATKTAALDRYIEELTIRRDAILSPVTVPQTTKTLPPATSSASLGAPKLTPEQRAERRRVVVLRPSPSVSLASTQPQSGPTLTTFVPTPPSGSPGTAPTITTSATAAAAASSTGSVASNVTTIQERAASVPIQVQRRESLMQRPRSLTGIETPAVSSTTSRRAGSPLQSAAITGFQITPTIQIDPQSLDVKKLTDAQFDTLVQKLFSLPIPDSSIEQFVNLAKAVLITGEPRHLESIAKCAVDLQNNYPQRISSTTIDNQPTSDVLNNILTIQEKRSLQFSTGFTEKIQEKSKQKLNDEQKKQLTRDGLACLRELVSVGKTQEAITLMDVLRNSKVTSDVLQKDPYLKSEFIRATRDLPDIEGLKRGNPVSIDQVAALLSSADFEIIGAKLTEALGTTGFQLRTTINLLNNANEIFILIKLSTMIEILSATDLKERDTLVKSYLKVANKMFDQGDAEGANAILGALMSPAVTRLQAAVSNQEEIQALYQKMSLATKSPYDFATLQSESFGGIVTICEAISEADKDKKMPLVNKYLADSDKMISKGDIEGANKILRAVKLSLGLFIEKDQAEIKRKLDLLDTKINESPKKSDIEGKSHSFIGLQALLRNLDMAKEKISELESTQKQYADFKTLSTEDEVHAKYNELKKRYEELASITQGKSLDDKKGLSQDVIDALIERRIIREQLRDLDQWLYGIDQLVRDEIANAQKPAQQLDAEIGKKSAELKQLKTQQEPENEEEIKELEQKIEKLETEIKLLKKESDELKEIITKQNKELQLWDGSTRDGVPPQFVEDARKKVTPEQLAKIRSAMQEKWSKAGDPIIVSKLNTIEENRIKQKKTWVGETPVTTSTPVLKSTLAKTVKRVSEKNPTESGVASSIEATLLAMSEKLQPPSQRK